LTDFEVFRQTDVGANLNQHSANKNIQLIKLNYMRKISILALLIITIMVILTSCKKDNNEPKSDFFIFPVGRSFLNTSSIDIKIGDKDYNSDFVFDSCGGYWLQIPKSDISDNESIIITIIRKNGDMDLFSEIVGYKQDWVSPSYYIDSDNEDIVLKANELTKGLSLNLEKAKAIQQFVINHVKMNIYKDAFLDKASKTYKLEFGTCMNFSRLYVALCRAVKIPARTIWGVVYGYNNDNIYDYHHQWAEESGYWHPCDFNYTTSFDLNDIRYLDLIYSAEENAIIKDRDLYNIMFEDLNYYNDYPVTLTARLGFKLKSDNRPDSMIVEYSYKY